jgi:hypothetical protein
MRALLALLALLYVGFFGFVQRIWFTVRDEVDYRRRRGSR